MATGGVEVLIHAPLNLRSIRIPANVLQFMKSVEWLDSAPVTVMPSNENPANRFGGELVSRFLADQVVPAPYGAPGCSLGHTRPKTQSLKI